MFVRSIRFKITVLYMAILALTLTSFSIILYHNVGRGLDSNLDTLLKSKSGGIAQAIDTYWEASKLETLESGVAPETLRKRRNINFAKIAQRWVREESTDPALLDIIVRVFDTDGRTIAASTNTQGLVSIPRKDFIAVLQGKKRFDTVSSGSQSGNITFRIFTTPVFENEKVAYIVQVASPLTAMQNALNNLRIALFILFPITVFATGIMGAFLAKVTLHPVDSMIKTIHKITAANMKLRIPVPETRDEIQKLAGTFNEMLERLEYAFTSQRQLFEDLSHELKTPLTILKGEFEVALKKARSADEYANIIRSALEEINKIVRIVENLLLLARFDSKEVYLNRKGLEVNILIRGILNNIKPLAELKNIKLVFSPNDDMSVYGDENQLKTLFINIIDNAVKYTPEKGKIQVSSRREGKFATIEVEDTGIGIKKEDLEHIFDRFYRVDKSRNSLGFGLGLSITKEIAEAHNGSIEVRSRPDIGTVFTIKLPLI